MESRLTPLDVPTQLYMRGTTPLPRRNLLGVTERSPAGGRSHRTACKAYVKTKGKLSEPHKREVSLLTWPRKACCPAPPCAERKAEAVHQNMKKNSTALHSTGKRGPAAGLGTGRPKNARRESGLEGRGSVFTKIEREWKT